MKNIISYFIFLTVINNCIYQVVLDNKMSENYAGRQRRPPTESARENILRAARETAARRMEIRDRENEAEAKAKADEAKAKAKADALEAKNILAFRSGQTGSISQAPGLSEKRYEEAKKQALRGLNKDTLTPKNDPTDW
jgi:hypothetical protein